MRLAVKSKEKKSKFLVKALVTVAKFLSSIAMSIIVCQFLVPLAAAERGYAGAFGGEWILIIAAFFVSYEVFTYAFDSITE